MSARAIGALAWLLMAAPALHAQPAGAQSSAIEGAVFDLSTGQPLTGVHVRVSTSAPQPDGGGRYGAMSGKDGRFSIANLPAGGYLLQGILPGYITAGKLEGMSVLPGITLKSGQRVTDYKLEMVRHAALTGRVVDEFGNPLDGISVEAEQLAGDQYLVQNPGRGETQTNDRGEFRIPVGPGRYRLKVNPPDESNHKETRTDGTSAPVYAETYFPSAASPSRATAIELKAGETAGPLEIHILRVRPITISGVVTGIPEGTRPWVRVRAGDDPGNLTVLDPAATDGEGKFSIPNARPGHYWLEAAYNVGSVRIQSLPVEVRAETGATNIVLAMKPGGELTGTIEAENGTGPFKITLQPDRNAVFSNPAAEGETDKDGAFRIAGVHAGNYRVVVQPMGPNTYIKSMQLDGAMQRAPTASSTFPRGAGGSHLKVAISANGAQISGAVLDADGQPLPNMLAEIRLLNNATGDDPPEMEQVRGFVNNGAYSIQGLAPGKYWLLAVDRIHSGDFTDPRVIKALAAEASPVEVKEGERLVKDLRIVKKQAADAK